MKSTFDLTVESLLNELQLGKMLKDVARGTARAASAVGGGLASTALGLGPTSGVNIGRSVDKKAGELATRYGGSSPETNYTNKATKTKYSNASKNYGIGSLRRGTSSSPSRSTSNQEIDTITPGEESLPKDINSSYTETTAQQATTSVSPTADASIKSIAPKITDKKIDNILAQTSLQPGDKQLIKSQLMTTVKQLKGNVSRNQLMDIMNKIMS